MTATTMEIMPAASSAAAVFMPVMDVNQAIARRNALVQFVNGIMNEDEDFGKIPGSKKNVLLKPGAEKLSSFFGFEPHFEQIAEDADWTGARHNGEPFYYIRYRCTLLRNGITVGSGEGSSNAWESKYRFRWVPEDQVPDQFDKARLAQQDGTRRFTEFDFAVDKGETGGKYGKPAEHWEMFRTAIENGTAVQGQKEMKNGKMAVTWTVAIGARMFRIPNPDICDVINTIQKMAQKRAFIAAILIATGASQFFTQDLEDLPLMTETGSQAAADAVAARKIEELRKTAPPAPPKAKAPEKPFEKQVAVDLINAYEPKLGSERFSDVLQNEGIKAVSDINDRETGRRLLRAMEAEYRQQQAELQGEDAEPGENTMQPITDADIPTELGGTYVPEKGNPAANRKARGTRSFTPEPSDPYGANG